MGSEMCIRDSINIKHIYDNFIPVQIFGYCKAKINSENSVDMQSAIAKGSGMTSRNHGLFPFELTPPPPKKDFFMWLTGWKINVFKTMQILYISFADSKEK